MRKTVPILALLVLAAASSAQTFVLNPIATSGYILTTTSTTTDYSLYSGRVTSTSHTTSPSGAITLRKVGWRAEFDLPATPTGSRLVSAIFETRVAVAIGTGIQVVSIRSYAGSGTINAAAPASSSLEKTLLAGTGTRARVGVGHALGSERYLGLDLACGAPGFPATSTSRDSWTVPTLTLTYAPVPVPEPASLAALGLGALVLMRRRK